MPTQKKVDSVKRLKDLFERCTVAVATDPSGMGVGMMTDLRRALREADVEYRVVKNRLAYLAADAAEKPALKEVIRGPTGIAFGYNDPTDPARALAKYIRDNRSPLKIRGAVLGDRTLGSDEVDWLAQLPSREVLIARLLGQMNGPIAGLARVLGAPVTGLATVLQRRVEALQE
jgi:large subunit ribosomal protein L10